MGNIIIWACWAFGLLLFGYAIIAVVTMFVALIVGARKDPDLIEVEPDQDWRDYL